MAKSTLLAAAVALVAFAPPTAAQQEGPTPTRRDLVFALMPIDLCFGDDSGACDSGPMPDRVRVQSARCVAEPPREGHPVALCRASFTYVHHYQRLNRTYRRLCVRVMQSPSPVAGAAPFWSWDTRGAQQQDCDARGI